MEDPSASTSRTLAFVGAALAFLGVAAGAFGAHGLARAWAAEPARLATYETAVRYQVWHALALLTLAALAPRLPLRLARAAGALFTVGVALFAGSLYLLSATGLKWLGAVAPAGGVALLLGWAALAAGALRGMRRTA